MVDRFELESYVSNPENPGFKGGAVTSQIQITYELNVIPGKAAELRQIAKEMVSFNDAGEPGTLRYNVYMNESETLFTFLETFVDSDACSLHGARFAEGEFVGQVLERTDGGRLCLLGPVSDDFKTWASDAGFEIEYFNFIDGFIH
ncbi:MAG: hypothetical protein CL458_06345 [Acidimicrobiaceae bacterium]|nr:hypothetical protein [Acidimicrobiaceae bacterium]|tara:strand:- start:1655 stop:2092 length:438 start_codon:yes stop_codon:yes gene_type:complete